MQSLVHELSDFLLLENTFHFFFGDDFACIALISIHLEDALDLPTDHGVEYLFEHISLVKWCAHRLIDNFLPHVLLTDGDHFKVAMRLDLALINLFKAYFVQLFFGLIDVFRLELVPPVLIAVLGGDSGCQYC